MTWDDALLDRFKNSGDQLADNVIQQLEQSGELTQVNQILNVLMTNDQPIPDTLPPVIQDYLHQTHQLPDWADPEKIKRAEQFFSARGPLFGVVLLCGSLPSLYAGGLGGAQILMATGQFDNHFERRAGETLKFILDVMQPAGLLADGQGIRTIQKVRLMHAAIRYYAKRSPDVWPAKAEWGAPINQEELAGTLLAFSTVALNAVAKLDVEVTPEEQEAYFHTWKVTAHLLGIEAGIIPDTIESANQLWQRIAARNFRRTDAGIKLAQCHVEFLEGLIPGKFADGLVISLMYYLLGKTMAHDYLALPQANWTSHLLGLAREVFDVSEDLFDDSPSIIQNVIEKLSLEFMDGLERHWTKGDSQPFRIPPSLTQK